MPPHAHPDRRPDSVAPARACVRHSDARHETVRKGCETLCDSAIKEPDSDNVTVIVVTLHFHENDPAAAPSDPTATVTEAMAALTTTASTATAAAPSVVKE